MRRKSSADKAIEMMGKIHRQSLRKMAAFSKNSPAPKMKISTITLGELDRAMNAFLDSRKRDPENDAKAVFAALKSFEKDRHLLDPKGAR